jgi:acetoin utilization deacetylase AcuC-like enzyme
MQPIALFYPEDHQKHQLRGHPERPERVEAIKKGLQEVGLWDSVPKLQPHKLSDKVLTAVHQNNYLTSLEQASAQEQMLDLDTYTTQESWQLAHNAAGGAVALAEAVWKGEFQTGFALTRPPGHHATPFRGMGFCLINNVAVAAEHLLQNLSAEHLAIIDIDLHHGNGTQDIFWQRSDVSYLSIHQAPFYPGTGSVQETGEGTGEGYTLNLPIPSQSGDIAFETLVEEIILPYLDNRKPDMLLISFGFDTHWRDPLGSMLVSAAGLFKIIRLLTNWADSYCSGKIGVFLEGGYDLEAGRVCGQAVGAGLVGQEWDDPIGPAPGAEGDAWRHILAEAKRVWKY